MQIKNCDIILPSLYDKNKKNIVSIRSRKTMDVNDKQCYSLTKKATRKQEQKK